MVGPGKDAIDRVSKQQDYAPEYPNPYKKPRYFPPTDRAELQGQIGLGFEHLLEQESELVSDLLLLCELQVELLEVLSWLELE